MKLARICLKDKSAFSNAILSWAQSKAPDVFPFADKNKAAHALDGLLILNENQSLSPEILEYKAAFDSLQKPIHNIDINGTLSVGISNMALWMERNKCESIFIIGSDALAKNPNLERFLAHI